MVHLNHSTLINGIWLTIGLIGQGIFGARFFVQWLSSEFQHRSIIPLSFWYLSIFGSFILFFYAWHKRDPVFILGQIAGIGIYIRNLYLIREQSKHES